ncbi:MAG: hypothetical protein MJ016_07565 [Victivallaceae bacterium]|nr:hypothetical protein [Victivallaceae bacterium]
MMKKILLAAAVAGSFGVDAALRVGVAEKELEVPLFAELYGYGPYCERRASVVHDPVYVRAYSFFDGKKRALVIYTDTCSTEDEYAREMRAKLASRYRLDPDGIAFVATHTHSSPALTNRSVQSSGIAVPEFQDTWRRAVLETAGKALADEEEIADVTAGKAPLEKPISRNRVDRKANITDPAIRWVRFRRADGSTKLLIHNHGAHGICCNGALFKEVSADWMGCANSLVKEKKLADMPLFLLGPAGDINPVNTCLDTGDASGNEKTATPYIEYLAADLEKGEKIDASEISYQLETVELPTVKQTAAELRSDAQALRDTDKRLGTQYWVRNANRLDEMAVLVDRGADLGAKTDFQVIRIGDFGIFFVPGELYIGPGKKLLDNAKVKYPLVATVSNGNGAYFFDEASAKRYPDATTKDNAVFGFYEIYIYMHLHRFKYQDTIGDFVVDRLLQLEAR